MGLDHQNKMIAKVFNPWNFKTNIRMAAARSRNVKMIAVFGMKMEPIRRKTPRLPEGCLEGCKSLMAKTIKAKGKHMRISGGRMEEKWRVGCAYEIGSLWSIARLRATYLLFICSYYQVSVVAVRLHKFLFNDRYGWSNELKDQMHVMTTGLL